MIVATLEGVFPQLGFALPEEVKQWWNQAQPIWFPIRGGGSATSHYACAYGMGRISAREDVAREFESCMRRVDPREGDERLSVTKRGESAGARRKRGSDKPRDSTKKARPGDLGRALRSVYDDTLRESVPDEFINLLGKLS